MNTLLTWAQNFAKKITIPKSLKTLSFFPIYKFWNSQTLNSFRTISLLPRFSKISEKSMHKRLINYINKKGILNKNQYGFRKYHSTNLALIELVVEIFFNRWMRENLLLTSFSIFLKHLTPLAITHCSKTWNNMA